MFFGVWKTEYSQPSFFFIFNKITNIIKKKLHDERKITITLLKHTLADILHLTEFILKKKYFYIIYYLKPNLALKITLILVVKWYFGNLHIKYNKIDV